MPEYWLWVTTRETVYASDLEEHKNEAWTCDEKTKYGDLILLYCNSKGKAVKGYPKSVFCYLMQVSGPTSFRDYLINNNLPLVPTARAISIDSIEKLDPILKNNDSMVLRLGSALEGTGTQFAIARVENHLKDFFLFDEDLFIEKEGSTFLPSVSMRQLFAFQLLMPSLTETSLVNLAFTSGLIAYALDLDEKQPLLAPATGRSTFTFSLKAHSKLRTKLIHNNGQVEMDAIFIARGDDKETCFVIEVKADATKSIAKHKLVYPILALSSKFPKI